MSEHAFDPADVDEASVEFVALLDHFRSLSTADVLARRDHARRQRRRLERDLIALEWLLSEQSRGSRAS